MCGIVGIFGRRGESISARLSQAVSLLAHRGPDMRAQELLPFGGIGAARLAVVDVKAPSQPYWSADGSWLGALDGEIFNHDWLREELEARGLACRTRCDAEALINAYAAADRERLLAGLDGQYAVLAAELASGIVRARVDEFGVRQLYFGTNGDGEFVIASEIKPLLANAVASARLRKLPQGCQLEYHAKTGQVKLDRYYDIREHITPQTFEPERLRALLSRAVAKRLPNEVPAGTLLGGIDSSAATVYAHRQTRRPLTAYTCATDPDAEDVRLGRLLAAQLGLRHRVGIVDERFVEEKLSEAVYRMETLNVYPILMYIVGARAMEMARADGVKVLLTGSGSDEINCGYDWVWELFDKSRYEANVFHIFNQMHGFDIWREGRAAAAHGLEARPVYLDKDLVHYVMSLPISTKVRDLAGERPLGKSHFKQAMTPLLPPETVARAKNCFHRSTNSFVFIDKVAHRLLPEDKAAHYFDTRIKGTPWEPWIFSRAGLLVHKLGSEFFPELAACPPPRSIPPYGDLDEWSRWNLSQQGTAMLEGARGVDMRRYEGLENGNGA